MNPCDFLIRIFFFRFTEPRTSCRKQQFRLSSRRVNLQKFLTTLLPASLSDMPFRLHACLLICLLGMCVCDHTHLGMPLRTTWGMGRGVCLFFHHVGSEDQTSGMTARALTCWATLPVFYAGLIPTMSRQVVFVGHRLHLFSLSTL